MSDESLGLVLAGCLVASPLIIGVGCGIYATEVMTAAAETPISKSMVASSTGSALVAVGAVCTGWLLLNSGFAGAIIFTLGAAIFAANKAYNSEEGTLDTAAKILNPLSYLHQKTQDTEEVTLSERYEYFKGYVKAALAFISLPALAMGTVTGLAAKFLANAHPEAVEKLQADINAQVEETFGLDSENAPAQQSL